LGRRRSPAYVVVNGVPTRCGFKHEPVLDLGCVAAGFGLRAIGGAPYAERTSPLSNFFPHRGRGPVSLFIVAGKRSR